MDHFNLSQAELAERSGVSRSSIGHMLNGRNQPSMDFLAGVLQEWPEIDADWLVMGKGPWKRSNTKETAPPKASKVPKPQKPASDLFSDTNASSPPLASVHPKVNDSEDREAYTSPESLLSSPQSMPKHAATTDAKELLVLFPDGTYRRFLPRD